MNELGLVKVDSTKGLPERVHAQISGCVVFATPSFYFPLERWVDFKSRQTSG